VIEIHAGPRIGGCAAILRIRGEAHDAMR
jgi:hypothetical protein